MDKKKFSQKSLRRSFDREEKKLMELKNDSIWLAVCFRALWSLSDEIRTKLNKIIQENLLYRTQSSKKRENR